VFGTRVPKDDVPVFGAFVKTRIQRNDATVFGLIYNIEVQDDGMTKMMSVADDGVISQEDIEWQRNRRVPVEASVLCVGYQEPGQGIRQALSAQPPITLDIVEACSGEEVCEFTRRLDFFRLIIDSRDAPSDELLAASIRLAGGAHPNTDTFIKTCGRELARLLANDGARLDGVLRRLL
jgi:hypothetical protein